jgi:hypothetical protein
VDDGALVGFGSSWPPNLTLEFDDTIEEGKATTPCPIMFQYLFQVSFAYDKWVVLGLKR